MHNSPLTADVTQTRTIAALVLGRLDRAIDLASREPATAALDPAIRLREIVFAVRRWLALADPHPYRPGEVVDMETGHLRSLVLMGIAELEARGDMQNYANNPAPGQRARRETSPREEIEAFAIGTDPGIEKAK